MKYTIVVAALLGLFSTSTVEARQWLGHQGRLNFLNELIQESVSDDEETQDHHSFVQLGDIPKPALYGNIALKSDEPPKYGEIPAYMDGAETNGGYKRVIPPQYTLERDDRLMNSLLTKYAREVTKDGALTGHFNQDDAKNVSMEVVQTHFGYNSNEAEKYLNGDRDGSNIFEDTWNHFDVNQDGLVEVERMPQFLRMVLGNALEVNLQ